jgi:acyl-CoA reductase-like NAD-dependent aldehyde dehydrogenase
MKHYQNFIDNRYVEPTSQKWLDSYDPYRGAPWARIPRSNSEDIDNAVASAARAFTEGEWPRLCASQRGRLLNKLAELVEAHAERLARIEVQDNGKLYRDTLTQVRYIPEHYRYHGGVADKLEGAVIPIDKPDVFNFTVYEPLGVVAAITPWNSPLVVAATKLAPALAAGNTVVLKPSEHASVSSLEFAALIVEAGFPPGVVNVVTGLGAEAGAALAAHPRVAKIAFTGGEAGGRSVYKSATDTFKKVVLELGGKSPNIVFDDANLDDAVNGAVAGIFAATGQSCVAGSRLLLQESIHDTFVERLKVRAASAVLGNPVEEMTQIGPVTTREQYQKILDYIQIARAGGATCVLGGAAAALAACGTGWFVEPTIFTGVTNDMRISQEEVFGPVLSVIRFSDEEDAVRIANDIKFGLAAGVWTQNVGRALRMSKRLQAGTVWVNTYRALSYMSPFGGYKHSGIGRLNGQSAVLEYVQQKSVWINTGTEPVANPFITR